MRFVRRFAAALGVLLGASSAAEAFDCQKAATPAEKAICADPTARGADAAMAAAFAKLIAEAAPTARPAMIAAQTQWIAARDGACADAKGAALAVCLTEQSLRRRAYLAAEPEAGPGAPGRLAPWFRYEKGGQGRAGVLMQLLRYPSPATPAERASDAAVDKLAGGVEQPEKDDPGADHFEFDRTMRLTYASPRFVSAWLDGYQDNGGAHPNTFSGGVNIDIEQGREANFGDLLDAAGARAIFALCLKSVVAQKRTRLDDDAPLSAEDMKQLIKNIAETTGKLSTWSFGVDKATVTYDAYAVGAYVEGAYTCEIPYATLKPLARPSFPLPSGDAP
jgi:uncharacterized protein YecT (DUF1311 family)